MKRLIPVMLVLIGGTSMTQVTGAQADSGQRAQLRTLATREAHAMQVSRAASTAHPLAGRSLTPLSVTHSQARATGSDLALPADVLSAANGVQGAVVSGTGVASTLHTTWAGYTSGVQATFDFKPTMTLGYRGSVFDNPQDSSTYATEGYKTAASQTPASTQDCSSTYSVPCETVLFTQTSGTQSTETIYAVATVNECVVEVQAVGDPDLISKNSDTALKAVASIFTLGISQAQQVCHMAGQAQLQPSISITGVGLGHTVHKQTKLTKSLNSGEKGIFILTFTDENPGTNTPTASVTFLNNGKAMGSPLDMQAVRSTDGSLFFAATVKFTAKKKALHIQAQFTANVGSSSDTKTLDFTVKPKKK